MNMHNGFPQWSILAVDDERTNLKVIQSTLERENKYSLYFALNGVKALQIAEAEKPDLILLDIMMPDMDGYQVCEELKRNPVTRDIPVIFITALGESKNETMGFKMGAVDYITKPISPPILKARVSAQLYLYDQKRALEETVMERTAEIYTSHIRTVGVLARAGEYKDLETGSHLDRMAKYSKRLAMRLQLKKSQVEIIGHSARLHDLGKVGIPDKVLKKPGKLTDGEWDTMQRHPEVGAKIIGEMRPKQKGFSSLLETGRKIALTHHERWDGSGYPNGLAGQDIPLEGRIVSVADVFDALVSKRVYKDPWPVDDALTWMKSKRGVMFDPIVLDQFLDMEEEIREIRKQHPDTDGSRSYLHTSDQEYEKEAVAHG